MTSSLRVNMTTGVACLGVAGLVAAPLSAPPTAEVVAAAAPAHTAEVQLSATIFDILTFPALQQYVLNTIEDVLIISAGLGESGVGLVNALVAYPEAFVTITQQILAGDLLGGLDTIEAGTIATSAAVILPTLDAAIERRERFLEVQLALQSAVPEAFLEVGAALFSAGDGIARATIIGTQALVDAILALDPGAIVDAVVDGTTGFFDAVGAGTQDIIDGIYSAQLTIAGALGAAPPAPVVPLSDVAAFSAPVDEVPEAAHFTDLSSTSDEPTTAMVGDDDSATDDEVTDEDATDDATEDVIVDGTTDDEVTDDEEATDEEATNEEATDEVNETQDPTPAEDTEPQPQTEPADNDQSEAGQPGVS